MMFNALPALEVRVATVAHVELGGGWWSLFSFPKGIGVEGVAEGDAILVEAQLNAMPV